MLGLTLWFIGFELEKNLNYLTEVGFYLGYIEVELENCSNYLAGYALILWYIGHILDIFNFPKSENLRRAKNLIPLLVVAN